jgi:hypothetical protein
MTSLAAHTTHARLTVLGVAIIAIVALALAPVAASAPPASVTYYASPLGSGNCVVPTSACTLASALIKAEAHDDHGSAVTVELAPGTYPSASIAGGSEASLTLAGAGASSTAVSGEGHSRTLTLSAGNKTALVTIENLTLEEGSEPSGYGANLYVSSAETLDLLDDTITDGQAASGGGGVALVGEGTVNISQSTFTGNTQHALEVALQKDAAHVNISGSTFAANPNGAISFASKADGNSLDIEDSTITHNGGGAIAWSATSRSAIYGSTISANGGEPALVLNGAGKGTTELQLGGDILSENEANCEVNEGTLVDDGYNLAGDSTCGLTQSTSKSAVTPAELGLLELAANGGPTDTQRITSASVAYDFVPGDAQLGVDGPTLCAGNDQRGIARSQPEATACDAGAYQVGPPVAFNPSPVGEAGGTLHLTGFNLSDVTSVTFGAGAAAGTVTSQDATSLAVLVPNVALGEEAITITNPDGSTRLAFTVVARPTITTTSLPSATHGVAYSAQMQATGGVPLYSWSATGLPPGVSINAFSGRISGTPLGISGKYIPTVTVADQVGGSATARLVLEVAGAATCVVNPIIHGLCASLRVTPVRPTIGGVSQSHRFWREGSLLARISSAHKPPPIGTTYSFTLNEKATVTLIFARRVGGRMVDGKCVAPNHKNAKRHKCKRSVRAGELSFAGHTATNKVRFQGRISRKHKLALGNYVLTILANSSGGSASKSLSFAIVK